MNTLGRMLFLAVLLMPLTARGVSPVVRPNIIFILADDLGYGDLGAYGQTKIKTPSLDRMAAEGMRLTAHYSGGNVCAPSRCVLLTGVHPGHAFVRDNREVQPEGQLPLPADTVTLPRLLQKAGYLTGAFGKWGLGAPQSTGRPLNQGFTRFVGYNCQRVAHSYYPASLWDDETVFPLNNHPPVAGHAKLEAAADPHEPASYRRFTGEDFAPDHYAEAALEFVRQASGRPFLLYYATIVPHLALQVPPDSLAEYAGAFPETPYTGDRGYLPHRTPRAAYAAMITRLDREVGRLMALVKELGLDERTMFVFTSDNGPLYDQLGGTDSEFFNSHGGLRGRKGSFYEGGFRVPCLVRWTGTIPAGAVSDWVSGFEDWLPTLTELAGVPWKHDLDGISFIPTLTGTPQPERPFLYRESPGYGGQQCVRVGDWKVIRTGLMKAQRARPGTAAVRSELYNLAADCAEAHDISADHPDIVQRLEAIMRDEHVPSKEFPIPALDR